jgi:predicted metal-binding protein
MKIGIIRCMQTEDMCPATTDLEFAREKKGAFEGIDGEIEVIGINSCGGCPGKKAVTRAAEMVKRGAEAIAFASCISKGSPIGFACPFAKKMRDAVSAGVGEEIKIFDYTH